MGAESIVGRDVEETLTSGSSVGCVGSDALGAGASGADSVGASSCSSPATEDLGCFGAAGLKKASMSREPVAGGEKEKSEWVEGRAPLLYVLRVCLDSLAREKGQRERRRGRLGRAAAIRWAARRVPRGPAPRPSALTAMFGLFHRVSTQGLILPFWRRQPRRGGCTVGTCISIFMRPERNQPTPCRSLF